MSLKTIVRKIAYATKSREETFKSKTLCGVKLRVLEGTIRTKVDQDDAWWFHLCKHHHTIYDIGCNVGYTALLALIQNRDRKMVLVDPNVKALQKASLNLIENHLGASVHFMSAFVGNKLNETIKFYTVGTGAAGSMYASHAETAASLNAFESVKTVTLDFLFEYYDIKPDLVKIDVEGAETLVMQSAKSLAKNTLCSFFIEMHKVETIGMEASTNSMLKWCNEMDYRCCYVK